MTYGYTRVSDKCKFVKKVSDKPKLKPIKQLVVKILGGGRLGPLAQAPQNFGNKLLDWLWLWLGLGLVTD